MGFRDLEKSLRELRQDTLKRRAQMRQLHSEISTQVVDYDPIKCLACAGDTEHTAAQHQEYLSLWCEEHLQWCGDHRDPNLQQRLQESLAQLDALTRLRRQLKEQREMFKRSLNELKNQSK